MQPAVSRPLRSSRQHVPKGTSCCSACTFSHSTSAPVLTAPEHQPVVHHEGMAGPGGWQQRQSYPCRGHARCCAWARRRGSSMCPDRLILYAKCAFRIWCALTCAFRICPTENHAGIPLGCALTCALKNRAYGASVPAGGVFLQGQNYGKCNLYLKILSPVNAFITSSTQHKTQT